MSQTHTEECDYRRSLRPFRCVCSWSEEEELEMLRSDYAKLLTLANQRIERRDAEITQLQIDVEKLEEKLFWCRASTRFWKRKINE